jgi:hypothetical protein
MRPGKSSLPLLIMGVFILLAITVKPGLKEQRLLLYGIVLPLMRPGTRSLQQLTAVVFILPISMATGLKGH